MGEEKYAAERRRSCYLTVIQAMELFFGYSHFLKHSLFKDLSRVKAGFKSVPLQSYFEIVGLASAKNWRQIQNIDGEERF